MSQVVFKPTFALSEQSHDTRISLNYVIWLKCQFCFRVTLPVYLTFHVTDEIIVSSSFLNISLFNVTSNKYWE